MDRLMAKLKEVRFARFDLGLPGNLTPVAAKDYRDLRARSAAGRRPTARTASSTTRTAGRPPASPISRSRRCTIWAGRRKPTEFCCPCWGRSTATISRAQPATNRSKDWKSWDGAAFGYEGYLADNYYALLAVIDRDRAVRVPAARGG